MPRPMLPPPRKTYFKGWKEAEEGLQPGDHVWVNRGFYQHHGIYVGEGRFVHKVAGSSTIATASFSKAISVLNAGGGLIYTGFEGFSPDPKDALHVVQYREGFHPLDTVDLAFSCLNSGDIYRLMEANCEHFATWCKTGQKQSRQVIFVKNLLAQSSTALSSLLAGVAVLARTTFAETRNTTVTQSHGRGIGRLLGLGRRSVITTVVEVDSRRVFWGAGLAAAASVGAYRAARAIKCWILRHQPHQLAFRTEPGTVLGVPSPEVDQTASTKKVALHKWRVRSPKELLAGIQKALPGLASSVRGVEDMLYYSYEEKDFMPLTEADIARLPRITSLQLKAA